MLWAKGNERDHSWNVNGRERRESSRRHRDLGPGWRNHAGKKSVLRVGEVLWGCFATQPAIKKKGDEGKKL